MSEKHTEITPSDEDLFERGGDKFGPAYARRILKVLRSDDVFIDFRKKGDLVEKRHIKAEMYAIVAHFVERSFPYLEEWTKNHPRSVPKAEKDEKYYGPEGFATITLDDFRSELQISDHEKVKEKPEKIFHDRVARAISILMTMAIYKQMPEDALAFLEDVEYFKETLEEEDEVGVIENPTLDHNLQAHFDDLFVKAQYRKEPTNFHDFVLEGAGTAGLVMTSLALAGPVFSKMIYGDTSPEHIAVCRKGLYGVVQDLTSINIDEFNYLKSLDGNLDPHTFSGILKLIEGYEADDAINFNLRDEVKNHLRSLVWNYEDTPARQDTIRCPAMYATSSVGAVNKYLWEYICMIAEQTFDKAVDLDMFHERTIRELETDSKVSQSE